MDGIPGTSKDPHKTRQKETDFCTEPRARRAKCNLNLQQLMKLIEDSDLSDIASDEESVDLYHPSDCSDVEEDHDFASDDEGGTNLERQAIETQDEIGNEARFVWKKKPYTGQTVDFENHFTATPAEVLTPRQYFKNFITSEMLQEIATQTNIYSFQKTSVSISTNADELEKIIGIYFRMGLIQMPRVRAYWETGTRCELIAGVMPRNRFDKLIRHIHFVDNSTAENQERMKRTGMRKGGSQNRKAVEPVPTHTNDDKCWRIRPFLDELRNNFLKTEEEKKCSVDEILIPFRGRCHMKQYIKNKPHCKWGLKLWGRAGESGILYDFDVYQGTRTGQYGDQTGYIYGLGAGVTIQLASTMDTSEARLLIADNYFTGLDLVTELTKRNIYFIGTVSEKRLKKCTLSNEKKMKQAGRGTIDSGVTTVDEGKEIVAVKWFDNRQCVLVSNFVGEEPKSTVERWDKRKKEKITVECPAIIPAYNKSMGGIDLLDNLTFNYKFEIRCNRWYMYIFWHLVQVAAVNSWLLYRRHARMTDQAPVPLRIFMADLATSLILAQKKRVGRPSLDMLESRNKNPKKCAAPTIPKDVRLDGISNWPIWNTKRNRCKICKDQNSFVSCEKCGIFLCLNKDRNCFRIFHT